MCYPCRASGSAGGEAEEKQDGDDADSEEETLEDKKIYILSGINHLGCDVKVETVFALL